VKKMTKKNKLIVSHDRRIQNQIKQAFSHRNKLPSKVKDVLWLYAEHDDSNYPETTNYSGKWLIFKENEEIDKWWLIIKHAVEEGKLGRYAKVSTALKNPIARSEDQKVICVYTYNYNDKEDTFRIREVLRKLGITEKISYKADVMTMMGKYAHKGDKKVIEFWG